MEKKSGKHWVNWANTNAVNSKKISGLVAPFKDNAAAFIKALENAGATVTISSTLRSAKRAYLFHWSWKIYLKKCKASDASKMDGVDIEWDHGDEAKSIAGAKEMVTGFGLAVPPSSNVAPSLTSNHISGLAMDITIFWTGKIKIKKKDGKEVEVEFMTNVNTNTNLHQVGESYNVFKHKSDKPHWSHTGR